MGVSYRVNDTVAHKQFILKTIYKHCISDASIEKFQQVERTALTSIDHPNINAIHDVGSMEDQTPFFVSEVVPGETLGERLKREGYLSVELVKPIFVQVCLGLAYLHEHGIDHRRIKPDNIMIIRNHLPPGRAPEVVKIVDFGVGKFTEREGGEFKALNETGEFFSNPAYMSPEQCSGHWVDQHTDTYTLGCVLMQSLVGTPPFFGADDDDDALTIMMQHQTEAPPTLKDKGSWMKLKFPQEIEKIVATMLAKSPSSRYRDLGIAAQDLTAVPTAAPVSSKIVKTKSGAKGKTQSGSRNKIMALVVGLAVVSACVVAVLTHLHH
jgi:serine/threonine-protein kinase